MRIRNKGFITVSSTLPLFSYFVSITLLTDIPPPAFNGYQHGNRRQTYDFEISQGNFTLPQPTFVLFPTSDPVADWEGLAAQVGSSSFLLNHYNTVRYPLFSICPVGFLPVE